MPRSLSSMESGILASLLSDIFVSKSIDYEIWDIIVRKSAHFIEYAALGCELCFLYAIEERIAERK